MVDRSLVVTSGNTTIVKKVTVGRPVRRVSAASTDINDLDGIDTSGKVNGSVLVYNSTTGKWTATLDLQDQNINGGTY